MPHKIVTIAGTTMSIVGGLISLYQISRPTPNKSNAWFFGGLAAVMLIVTVVEFRAEKKQPTTGPMPSMNKTGVKDYSPNRSSLVVVSAVILVVALSAAVVYSLVRGPASIFITNSPQFNNSSQVNNPSSVDHPQDGSSPKKIPSAGTAEAALHVNAKKYKTAFLHSQRMEGAVWNVDGVDAVPVDSPSPSFTVLLLKEGPHRISAKMGAESCNANVTVPVQEQNVTLTCHSE